jgi:CRP-like cAMP-binding protein
MSYSRALIQESGKRRVDHDRGISDRPTIAKHCIENALLSALCQSDIELLRPESVVFSRGRILFDRGSRMDRVYFPHTALVSLVTDLRDGGSIESATIGSEGMVGAFAINGDSIALSRSVIQIPGRCDVVPLDRMKKAFDRSKAIRVLLGYYQQGFAAQILQQVACNAAHDVLSRCARWILSGLDRTGGDVVPLTHEFLGEILGTTRPTVSVALKELQNARLIETTYGRIRVVDRSGLENASCECYGVIREAYTRLLPTTFA